jgi:hypothetical protein
MKAQDLSASILKGGRLAFKIRGNKYRLVVQMNQASGTKQANQTGRTVTLRSSVNEPGSRAAARLPRLVSRRRGRH